MPQIFVIIVLISLSFAGDTPRAVVDPVASLARVTLVLSVFGAIAGAAWAGVLLCARAVDRAGSLAAIRWSGRVILAARACGLAWHIFAVFVLGWLGLVRSFTGDLVLVDELLASLPAFVFLLVTYRMGYPIDRRIREATLIRSLDAADPVYPFPGPWGSVLAAARNSLAILFVPLVFILAWSEGLDRVLATGRVSGTLDTSPDWVAASFPSLARLTGSLLIFALIPAVMTRVWDTVAIPPGQLRGLLERLASAHRVRLRRFLVWRTNGAMLNGAVIGITPWLRYIVLTDALLDHLRVAEVEAVAAHEVAHVREHHMLWLALSILGAAMLSGEGVALLLGLAGVGEQTSVWVAGLVSLATVLLVLGAVSRRFEWQADAFAARHMSGPRAALVTEQAAGVMSSALAVVARRNGIPESRFTWRHGSIAVRRRRLEKLVGQPVEAMPIDRRVRTIKLVALAVFAAGLGITVWGFWGGWSAGVG